MGLMPKPRRTLAAHSQPSLPGLNTGLDLTTYKTIRLAVSGDVELTRLETRLIDTPAFQRLRFIRQLGAAYLVYPTALHTRFDHSLGTLGAARRMIEAIRGNARAHSEERDIPPEEELLARLFALLHDIGHIPFGHTLEDELGLFARHDASRERIERFVGPESAAGRLLRPALGGELYQRLLRLFEAAAGQCEPAADDVYILDLVTNTICADLLDYLARDAFFCNLSVEAGDRFYRYLALRRHGGRRRLVVQLWKENKDAPRRDVLGELIRLLDNRYVLSERVYFHHAKLVAGTMVGAAVARALAAGTLDPAELFDLGDDTLLWRLARGEPPQAAGLARAVLERRLWKLAARWDREALGAEGVAGTVAGPPHAADGEDRAPAVEHLLARLHADAARRRRLEERRAAELGLDPGELLIHCPPLKMAMKLADTMVLWRGAIRPLRDCRDDALTGIKLQAILDSHRNLWATRVFVPPERLAAREALARLTPPERRQWLGGE